MRYPCVVQRTVRLLLHEVHAQLRGNRPEPVALRVRQEYPRQIVDVRHLRRNRQTVTVEEAKIEPHVMPDDWRRPNEPQDVVGDVLKRRRIVQVLPLDTGVPLDEFANLHLCAGVGERLELVDRLVTAELDGPDFDDAVGIRVESSGLYVDSDPYLVERRWLHRSHVRVNIRIGAAKLDGCASSSIRQEAP